MLSQEALKRHADLVDKIASALGLDLEEKAMRGEISIDEVTDAVLRCTKCSAPEACSAWIDRQTVPAQDTPGYCRNKDLFARLTPVEG